MCSYGLVQSSSTLYCYPSRISTTENEKINYIVVDKCTVLSLGGVKKLTDVLFGDIPLWYIKKLVGVVYIRLNFKNRNVRYDISLVSGCI